MRTVSLLQALLFDLVLRTAFALLHFPPMGLAFSPSTRPRTREGSGTTRGLLATTSSPCPLMTKLPQVLRIFVLCSTLSAVVLALPQLRLLHRSARPIPIMSGLFPPPLARSSSSLRLKRRLPVTLRAPRSRTRLARTICRIPFSLEPPFFRPMIYQKHRGLFAPHNDHCSFSHPA